MVSTDCVCFVFTARCAADSSAMARIADHFAHTCIAFWPRHVCHGLLRRFDDVIGQADV